MGKYIKKSKLAGDVPVSDFSNPITFGFRTRAAKNLALQRLRSDSTSPSDDADSFRYLQLRSRRLIKLPLLADDTKKHLVAKNRTRNPRAKSVTPEKIESAALVIQTEEGCGSNEGKYGSDCNFGESEDRSTRETTPCNLTRDSEATQNVPLSSEIEDFFAYAEQKQQRFFIEKYNFDIVSDNPLPGRYEWVKLEP